MVLGVRAEAAEEKHKALVVVAEGVVEGVGEEAPAEVAVEGMHLGMPAKEIAL